ncbi:uncharacterized protein [Ptychodera flava]|uniref:uncharacterized protein n=1 Tax=Ptychodera flava TaxID=63121 RepID=UPI00396AA98D
MLNEMKENQERMEERLRRIEKTTKKDYVEDFKLTKEDPEYVHLMGALGKEYVHSTLRDISRQKIQRIIQSIMPAAAASLSKMQYLTSLCLRKLGDWRQEEIRKLLGEAGRTKYLKMTTKKLTKNLCAQKFVKADRNAEIEIALLRKFVREESPRHHGFFSSYSLWRARLAASVTDLERFFQFDVNFDYSL